MTVAEQEIAVVFDFDGLLMDTETTLFASWEYEWSQWGLEIDVATFFADHGGDIAEEKYAALAAAVGPAYDRALSHARRVAFRDELHADLDLNPGMADWIDQAVADSRVLAVASSSPRGWVMSHLDRVGVLGCFTALACGDEVDAHKPAPDVYLLALHRLGLSPTAAVAVEDTPHGVAAAQAAGLRAIAIPNAFVPPFRFHAADLLLRSALEMDLEDALAAVRRSEPDAPQG
ncbi:HAD-IA family hydrolase [Nocardioides sp. LHG3406-4]|uniref:HAD-IA family hydrolase n=1 Tax=Nocardioides sp. LHG3406-4 TaxID=2804575 RepID=UPI003CF8D7A7